MSQKIKTQKRDMLVCNWNEPISTGHKAGRYKKYSESEEHKGSQKIRYLLFSGAHVIICLLLCSGIAQGMKMTALPVPTL
jgi:hypothetical protein